MECFSANVFSYEGYSRTYSNALWSATSINYSLISLAWGYLIDRREGFIVYPSDFRSEATLELQSFYNLPFPIHIADESKFLPLIIPIHDTCQWVIVVNIRRVTIWTVCVLGGSYRIQTDCVTYDTIVGVVHITTVALANTCSVDLAIDALVPTTKWSLSTVFSVLWRTLNRS